MNKSATSPEIASGSCAGAEVCPLSRVPVGATVCVKAFAASPEIRAQLRALGFCEKQEVKLLSGGANFSCEVCDAKLDLNVELAEAILVEPLALPVRQLKNLLAVDSQNARAKSPARMAFRAALIFCAALIVGAVSYTHLSG